MLRQAKDLESYKLRARDGDIGRVNEFYFDDRYWTVRYLVADTAGWLSGRRVLISPYALRPANVIDRVLPVNLSKKQIEGSPSLATQEPVSRQNERQYYGYYGWPDYAYGSYMWGGAPYIQRDIEASRELRRHEDAWDPNLRSTNDVTGHFIQAQDGEVGHVADFPINDECWAIRYLIVDTKNWWSGKHVLISPQWIEHVSWRVQGVCQPDPRNHQAGARVQAGLVQPTVRSRAACGLHSTRLLGRCPDRRQEQCYRASRPSVGQAVSRGRTLAAKVRRPFKQPKWRLRAARRRDGIAPCA